MVEFLLYILKILVLTSFIAFFLGVLVYLVSEGIEAVEELLRKVFDKKKKLK